MNPVLFSSYNALDGGDGENFISLIHAGFTYSDVGYDTTYNDGTLTDPFDGA